MRDSRFLTDSWCSTDAYAAVVEHSDLAKIITAGRSGDGAEIRAAFEDVAMPPALTGAIGAAYAELGGGPVAVRSSATAEDLPQAAFAGQQDTYLNVIGEPDVLDRGTPLLGVAVDRAGGGLSPWPSVIPGDTPDPPGRRPSSDRGGGAADGRRGVRRRDVHREPGHRRPRGGGHRRQPRTRRGGGFRRRSRRTTTCSTHAAGSGSVRRGGARS